MRKVITYPMFLIAIGFLIATICIRFTNAELTSVEVFIKFWWFWLLELFVFIVVAKTIKRLEQ